MQCMEQQAGINVAGLFLFPAAVFCFYNAAEQGFEAAEEESSMPTKLNHLFLASVLFLFGSVSVGYCADYGDIVINEVLTNPLEGGDHFFLHEGVEYVSDWVEFYNKGDETIVLSDLYISDKCHLPDQWKIGDNGAGNAVTIELGPHEFRRIWFPGLFLEENNDLTPNPPDKAPFALGSGGEWLGLYRKLSEEEFVLVDGLVIPELLSDMSYGCETDGDAEHRNYLSEPTPELTNTTTDNLPPKIEVSSYRGIRFLPDDAIDYTVKIEENQLVRIRAKVIDLDRDNPEDANIASVTVFYRVSGGGSFLSLPMELSIDPRAADDGVYEAVVPGQAAGSVVEFYVAAEDNQGGRTELWWSTLYAPASDKDVGFRYPVGTVGAFDTTIRLNEVLAANGDCVPGDEMNDPAEDCNKGGLDNKGNADDWVELYNIGGSAASLDNLYITNNELDPTRFKLDDYGNFSPNVSSGALIASGHMLIWCDNESHENAANYIHSNFTLSANSDEVLLIAYKDANEDGVPELFRIMDMISWGAGEVRDQPDKPWLGSQDEDWSLGRHPEDAAEAEWGRMEPTPGLINAPGDVNTGFVPYLNVRGWDPVRPLEEDTITFTAEAWDDAPGFTVMLHFKLFSGGEEQVVEMLDNGTGGDAQAGDGVFSAQINKPDDEPRFAGKMRYYVMVTDADDNQRRVPRHAAVWGLFHIGELPNESAGSLGPGHPVITEVMAANRGCDCSRTCSCEELADPLPYGCKPEEEDSYRNADDWIEIYNPHDDAISLDNYYLSDRRDWTMRWKFPAGNGSILGAGERMIIWCDGEPLETIDTLAKTEYHTNFQLDAGSDEILLLYQNPSRERQIVDYIRFEDQIDDISCGKKSGEEAVPFAETALLVDSTMGTANVQFAAQAAAITEQEAGAGAPKALCAGSQIHIEGVSLDKAAAVFVVKPLVDTEFGAIIYDEKAHGDEIEWDFAGRIAGMEPVEVNPGSWSVQDGSIVMTLPADLEDGPYLLCVLSGYNETWYKGGVPWNSLPFEITSEGCSTGDYDFKRADPNGDGSSDISDAIAVLSYLFSSESLDCLDAGDANDDGNMNIADVVKILDYLFAGGLDPAAPFSDCGPDPTPDELGCDYYDPASCAE